MDQPESGLPRRLYRDTGLGLMMLLVAFFDGILYNRAASWWGLVYLAPIGLFTGSLYASFRMLFHMGQVSAYRHVQRELERIDVHLTEAERLAREIEP